MFSLSQFCFAKVTNSDIRDHTDYVVFLSFRVIIESNNMYEYHRVYAVVVCQCSRKLSGGRSRGAIH